MDKFEKTVMITTGIVFGGGAFIGVLVVTSYLLSNVFMWAISG